jgi:hypothetical protein
MFYDVQTTNLTYVDKWHFLLQKNVIFSVTYCSVLHVHIFVLLLLVYFFGQVKMSMFYNVQTTNLTMVGIKNAMHSKYL